MCHRSIRTLPNSRVSMRCNTEMGPPSGVPVHAALSCTARALTLITCHQSDAHFFIPTKNQHDMQLHHARLNGICIAWNKNRNREVRHVHVTKHVVKGLHELLPLLMGEGGAHMLEEQKGLTKSHKKQPAAMFYCRCPKIHAAT